METSDFHVLNRVDWQFFVSLTFRKVVSERVQFTMVFSYLRDCARIFGIHFHALLWVVRRERGETFGRLHLHLLVGGASSCRCTTATCFMLIRSWEAFGGGWARVYLYDARLNAGEYLSKPERFDTGLTGGEAYESGKFNARLVELTIAHAVRQKWCRRRDIHAVGRV
jgi:hypothetical protein